jgi:hypothetical protein
MSSCAPAAQRHDVGPIARREFERVDINLNWICVELTGFEPVTPSLLKMRSNRADLEKQGPLKALWGGCGANDVRRGKRE